MIFIACTGHASAIDAKVSPISKLCNKTKKKPKKKRRNEGRNKSVKSIFIRKMEQSNCLIWRVFELLFSGL